MLNNCYFFAADENSGIQEVYLALSDMIMFAICISRMTVIFISLNAFGAEKLNGKVKSLSKDPVLSISSTGNYWLFIVWVVGVSAFIYQILTHTGHLQCKFIANLDLRMIDVHFNTSVYLWWGWLCYYRAQLEPKSCLTNFWPGEFEPHLRSWLIVQQSATTAACTPPYMSRERLLQMTAASDDHLAFCTFLLGEQKLTQAWMFNIYSWIAAVAYPLQILWPWDHTCEFF